MTDETTYLQGKWRCSQCESLNRMARDNVCSKCFDLALEEDEKKLQCEHLWARQDEIGRPYCAACGMAWSLVRRIDDPVGSPGERCRSCKRMFVDGETCPRGGCPMGGDV